MTASVPLTVGILTLPLYTNYGGILQAYALCHYLSQQGARPVLLDRRIAPASWGKRVLRQVLAQLPFQNIRNIRQQTLKARQLKRFVRQHIPVSPELHSSDALRAYVVQTGVTVLVTGSDQVWRYQYTQRCWQDYFLAFASQDEAGFPRKVAYAASMGRSEWEDPQSLPEVARLLESFSAISLRERSGVEQCRRLVPGMMVQPVYDPTLLLDAAHYRALYESEPRVNLTHPPGLVTYLLDQAGLKTQLESAYLKACALLDNELEPGSSIHLGEKLSSGSHPDIGDWLVAIDRASFVVTDSFHGMVFSIIFRKNFVVLVNQDRGASRFTDFLTPLGLEERLLDDTGPISPRIFSPINYNAVQPEINRGIEHSKAFLRQAGLSM